MSEESVIQNLHEYEDRVNEAILKLAELNVKEAENTARANRPWTDDTGMAAQGLKGTADKDRDGVRMVLAHTVEHGLYLELAMGRRFAIIEETLRRQATQAYRDLKELLS